jgi:glycine/D-amino acid oxidase-like deaminating enzyme
MGRRRFLALASATLGAAALPAPAARAQRRRTARTAPKIIVVGAGAMGGWTALHLAEMGAEVTMIDAYGAGHSRAASGGETRLTRADYENPLYARLALEAYDMWRARELSWRRDLLIASG